MRDGARGTGRIPRGAARRDEGERNGNSETGHAAQRTGVSAGGIDAYGLQGIGKRSIEVPRLGGSSVEARGGGKRLPANQRCRGCDHSSVGGDIVFRAGRPTETYKGIGKYDLNLEGMPVFGDDAGPHGSATSDSQRTMVTATTTQVLAIIVSFGGPESLERWTQRLGALLQQYAVGTNIVTNVVT